MGRCSLPARSCCGNVTAPCENTILAAPLPRGTRGTPAHGAGKPPSQPADKAKTSACAGGPENQARPVCGLVCGPSGGWGKTWRVSRPVPVPRPLFTVALWGCSACLCRFPLILPVLPRLSFARFPLALGPLLAALPWLAGSVVLLVSGGLWWLLLAPLAFPFGGLLPVLPGRCLLLLPLRLRLVPLLSGAAWAGPVVLLLAVSVWCGVGRSVSLFLCGLAFKPALFSGKRKPPAR